MTGVTCSWEVQTLMSQAKSPKIAEGGKITGQLRSMRPVTNFGISGMEEVVRISVKELWQPQTVDTFCSALRIRPPVGIGRSGDGARITGWSRSMPTAPCFGKRLMVQVWTTFAMMPRSFQMEILSLQDIPIPLLGRKKATTAKERAIFGW